MKPEKEAAIRERLEQMKQAKAIVEAEKAAGWGSNATVVLDLIKARIRGLELSLHPAATSE